MLMFVVVVDEISISIPRRRPADPQKIVDDWNAPLLPRSQNPPNPEPPETLEPQTPVSACSPPSNQFSCASVPSAWLTL